MLPYEWAILKNILIDPTATVEPAATIEPTATAHSAYMHQGAIWKTLPASPQLTANNTCPNPKG